MAGVGHARRARGHAALISQARSEVRGIYGALEVFLRLRRAGVRTSGKGSAGDLVKRGFDADGPNEAWSAGITHAETRRGRLYLALVMGVWSRRIVGWAMGPSITTEPADEALKMALARRNNLKGCVYHDGHGAQCVSLLPSRTMREHDVRPSTGSISSPRDNAAVESLTGLVESECVHARAYGTRDDAAPDLLECIEGAGIRSTLGDLGPAEFEEANWPEGRRRTEAT